MWDSKEYYSKNKERIKERVRNYGKTHKEEIRKRRVLKKEKLEEKRVVETIAEKERIINGSDDVLWKDIKGFEGQYQMSEDREIRKLPYTVTQSDGKGNTYTRTFKCKKVTQHIDDGGYLSVDLNGDTYRVHWLFYNTFIGDSTGYVVDHIDRNKLNNDPSNLRLLTHDLNNLNRTLPYKPSITNVNKYYQKKHKETRGGISKPFLLCFCEDGKRKYFYFATYEEAENKYRELYNERQNKIDASSKVFTINS